MSNFLIQFAQTSVCKYTFVTTPQQMQNGCVVEKWGESVAERQRNPLLATSSPSSTSSPQRPQRHLRFPAFADDPFRALAITYDKIKNDIEALNGPNFLTTALIDYILQHVLPKDLPDDMLIGSLNSFTYQSENQKNIGIQGNQHTKHAS